jgi:hypothetical protein
MRSAGGYGLGGARTGARYFSHSPAAPAQVVQNVSQAVRAFYLAGNKARFDGFARTGEKRYRAVSDVQDSVRQTLDMHAPLAKGSYIDFKVSPTITAVGPLASVPRSEHGSESSACLSADSFTAATGLSSSALMSDLAVDFARALKQLAAVFNDLKHLSALGDLPIVLYDSSTLRVRFPGCDVDTVEALCLELNIRRGIVGQEAGFEEQCGTHMALLFPFAPSKTPSHAEQDYTRPKKRLRSQRDRVEWRQMLSPQSNRSAASHSDSHSIIEHHELADNPWLSSPSGYSSLHSSELDGEHEVAKLFEPTYPSYNAHSQGAYVGVEGIHRFLQECERAQR